MPLMNCVGKNCPVPRLSAVPTTVPCSAVVHSYPPSSTYRSINRSIENSPTHHFSTHPLITAGSIPNWNKNFLFHLSIPVPNLSLLIVESLFFILPLISIQRSVLANPCKFPPFFASPTYCTAINSYPSVRVSFTSNVQGIHLSASVPSIIFKRNSFITHTTLSVAFQSSISCSFRYLLRRHSGS